MSTSVSQAAVRRRDPERTKEAILSAATEEFARAGFSGARVDEIAAKTESTKRMIYYYFGSKEQLYLKVMEAAYDTIRQLEQTIDVEGLAPEEALRRLAEQTYDHHTSNPDFVRLVTIENIHRAEFLSRSEVIPARNRTAVLILEKVLARGVASGAFRKDLDAIDVHFMISSYCFDHVASRYTFRALFGRDMLDPALQGRYRKLVGDMVVATVTDVAAAQRD